MSGLKNRREEENRWHRVGCGVGVIPSFPIFSAGFTKDGSGASEVDRCTHERRVNSFDGAMSQPLGLRRAETRVIPMRELRFLVIVRIDLAACLFGAAALLKVIL